MWESIGTTAMASCSHTNAGLRAINASVPSKCQGLTLDGKMSHQRIATKDPVFGDVCKSGLRWKVIAHEAMMEFPNLALLIQAAMNSSGQLARGEHELQKLQRILNGVSQAEKLVDLQSILVNFDCSTCIELW